MSDLHPPSKRILFRADGDVVIASGHLRRCLTLADQLRVWGYECLFACRASSTSFNYLIRQQDFPIVELADGNWNPAEDAAALIAAFEEDEHFKAVVVDHYGLDAEWERRIRAIASRVVVIDDLAHRRHDCDLLVDAAPGDIARYDGYLPSYCSKLLGPNYALLRPEFARLRGALPLRSGVVSRIFISFGGVDSQNLTGKTIAAIRSLCPLIGIDAVLTSLSPHCDLLRSYAQDDAHLSLHIDTPDIANLMAQADLAIGAGGSTSWERACLGLPSIIAVIADNQRATALSLEEYGCAIAVPAGPNFEAELRNLIEWLLPRPVLLRLMSAAGKALGDGRGATRVAQAIVQRTIVVRPVCAHDAKKVWEWRNAPEVRATAIDPSEISWENHRVWFTGRLTDPKTVMLIGVEQDDEVGFIRFDLDRDIATISIFLAPGYEGHGIGGALLRAGEQWVSAHHANICRFHADVRHGNGASVALFRRAGYRPTLSSFERIIND